MIGITQIAEDVCQAMDWNYSYLAEAKGLAEAGKPEDAVAAYLDAWRNCTSHRRPWTMAYVEAVRMAAGDTQVDEAIQAIENFLETPLNMMCHAPFLAVSDETIFLGVRDHATLMRICDKAFDAADEWGNSMWGTTDCIVKAILHLAVLPECESKDLIPLFGWLVTCSCREWKWARTWDEQNLGCSGHNWWLHTLRGFYLGGLHFPELAKFSQFRAFAPEYFERELNLLMEYDGFTRERSSGYHWETVNHWMSILHHTSCDTVSFPQWFYDKIKTVADTVWKTALPHGGYPLWGDTKSLYKEELRNLLPTMAAALQIPEMKYVALQLFPDWQPPYPEFLPGYGRNLWHDWVHLQASPPALPTPDTVLPVSKYYMMRTDWTPQADAITFVAGPQGAIVTSHDHTHVGTLEMFVRGSPILIDNSSGPYGTDSSRNWRVSSAAHNVATIDGEDHIPVLNEWRWKYPVCPTVDAWKTTENYAYCSVTHEGYSRLPNPVHGTRRKLFWLRGGYAILIDRFTVSAEATHTYDIHFHINGKCEVLDNGCVMTKNDVGNLLIVPVQDLSGTPSIEECPYPIEGYHNPLHLQYSDTAAGNQLYVTLLVPFGTICPLVEVESLSVECDNRLLSPFEATALAITIDGCRDLYFDQHMHWNLPWQTGGVSGTQRLYHSRAMKNQV